MRRDTIFKTISIVMTFLLAGCATYTPTLVRLDPSGPNVSKAAQGDLTLYVEEYATSSKSEIAFDEDLANEGVLPLLISVANRGQDVSEVNAEDIVVRGDYVLKRLAPEEAADKAKREAVGKAIGWSLIVPIIAIPVAATASALHTSGVNKKIVADFSAKAFQSGEIQPNSDRSGFVYLELPEAMQDTSGLNLELVAKNVATGEVVNLTAPVPAATFTSKKQASPPEDDSVAAEFPKETASSPSESSSLLGSPGGDDPTAAEFGM